MSISRSMESKGKEIAMGSGAREATPKPEAGASTLTAPASPTPSTPTTSAFALIWAYMIRVVGVGVVLWLCSLLWLPAVRGIARWATIYLPYISAAALVVTATVHIPYSRIPTLRILRPASD